MPIATTTGLHATFSTAAGAVRRVDTAIDFPAHWARGQGDFYGSGLAGSDGDVPSAEWEGRIVIPADGSYTFFTRTSDGVLLEIDGAAIINDWSAGGVRDRSGEVSLGQGEYPLRMTTYLDRTSSQAAARLEWSVPSGGREAVPSHALLPPVTAGGSAPTIIAAGPVLVRSSEAVLGIDTDEPTVVALEYGPTASYGIVARSLASSTRHTLDLNGLLVDSDVYYRATVADRSGGSAVTVGQFHTREIDALGTGLFARFVSRFGTVRRVDPIVAFPTHRSRAGEFFGSGLASEADEQLSAEWVGLIHAPMSGGYSFEVDSDDGVKLQIDGALVIFDWSDGGPRTSTGSLHLEEGWHGLSLGVYDAKFSRDTGAVLRWAPPGATSPAVVPSSVLAAASPIGDSTAPLVSTLGTSLVQGTSATLAVGLDEPADVLVEWGTNPGSYTRWLRTDVRVNHVINLDGLVGETTYYYRVAATDPVGNVVWTEELSFVTGSQGSPGGWGAPPVPGGRCLTVWCANIGDLAGDSCYESYPTFCGGCPRPACGANSGGCLQTGGRDGWCHDIGALVGDSCRGENSFESPFGGPNPCWYCGENCTAGTFRSPPGGTPEDAPPGGLIGTFRTRAGVSSRVVPRVDFDSHRALAGSFYGSGLAVGPGEVAEAEFAGLIKADSSEVYSFVTQTNDGVTLLIDDRVVVTDWNDGGLRTNSGQIPLQRGWHTIEMRTYNTEDTPTARAVLSWSSESDPVVVVVPQDHLAPIVVTGDDTEPEILWHGPRLLLDRSVTIGVETDELTTVRVEWGLTASYGNRVEVMHVGFDHNLPITGLAPSTTYHYRVVATDLTGNTSLSGDATFTTHADHSGAVGGLLGQYQTARGQVLRVDSTVDFVSHPVGPGNDYFYTGLQTAGEIAYATWSGMVLADTDDRFIFSVQTGDGVQLVVAGQVLILEWDDGGHWVSGAVDLTEGWHDIELRTYTAGGNPSAEAILRWQAPGLPLEVVPQDHLAPAAFPGDDEAPVFQSVEVLRVSDTDATLRIVTNELTTLSIGFGLDGGLGEVAQAARPDTVHMVTLTDLEPGTAYLFEVTATDLAGLDTAAPPGTFTTTSVPLLASGGVWGVYETDRGSHAGHVNEVNFPVHPVGPGGGSYGTGLTASDGVIEARWTGLLRVDVSGHYSFITETDDGVVLLIDNRLVLADPTGGGVRTNMGSIGLMAGWHTIQMRVVNEPGSADTGAILSWHPPSASGPTVVPRDHLAEERPAEIVSLFVRDVTTHSADVLLATDEATSVRLTYGETTAYGELVTSAVSAESHVIRLAGLTPDTTYHFTLEVRDSAGFVTPSGRDNTFTTDAIPRPAPSIACFDDALYLGSSVSGFDPAVFAGDRASVCSAEAAPGSHITGFTLDVVDAQRTRVQLIDRTYTLPFAFAAPGCDEPEWCDPGGTRALFFKESTPAGDYDLVYRAYADNGGVTEATYPFVLVDLRTALVRVRHALAGYDAAGAVAGADSEALLLSSDVYRHAIAALDGDHLPTVLLALREMHDELLSVRDGLQANTPLLLELEMLVSEAYRAAVLHSRREVGFDHLSTREHSVRVGLNRAWEHTDLATSTQNPGRDAYAAVNRYRRLQHDSVIVAERVVADPVQSLTDLNRASDLVDLVDGGADALSRLVQASPTMFGGAEAAALSEAASELSVEVERYSSGALGNYEIATVIHDLFGLLADIRRAESAYLGVGEFRHYIALAAYLAVEKAIDNAARNICGTYSHPLIVEAYRRWRHLAELIESFVATRDEAFLDEFVTLVLAPDGRWLTEGPTPDHAVAAYPGVLCFIAAVYNSAYSDEGDNDSLFDEPLLVISGCPNTPIDWYSEQCQ